MLSSWHRHHKQTVKLSTCTSLYSVGCCARVGVNTLCGCEAPQTQGACNLIPHSGCYMANVGPGGFGAYHGCAGLVYKNHLGGWASKPCVPSPLLLLSSALCSSTDPLCTVCIMHPHPTGHAPVSKGLVLAAVGSSVISNAARASHRQLPRPLVVLSHSFAFRTPGELLFGCFLLYYFRVLERQAGSNKYGSYAAVVTGLSYVLQLGISSILQLKAPLAPGPLPLVFASFVPFLLDIPPTSHFTVMGYKMSDKVSGVLAQLSD